MPGPEGLACEDPSDESAERELLIHLLDVRQDRMLYTHRTQEKAADRYDRWESARKGTTIVLTVLTSGTLITAIAGLLLNEVWGNFAVATIATLATLAAFLGDFLDFAGKSSAHQQAATKLRSIHNDYESIISDLTSGAISNDEARTIRDDLQHREAELLRDAPRTTRRDYKKASRALATDEKPMSTRQEIDQRTPGRSTYKHGQEDTQ
ncbi:SLATT domain-containing protein [Corynebacterium spheniscorum]|uniref:SMODS and SLOG-associating 2TM effector domain-containing protein n=1 Tax=Corynebacterium spheniscorum TaxID=185761 RepID=A0A1I2QK41_9CORY|nr:SLATT domain-containing protein [Corynebacterium spheniscorum]KAA8719357.1 SLATT domain-containing protein [Corynebacterium spheniscorum]SFG27983.1 hypothetical protein SAMN05660282_00465 [Corynebacterium spheniscorum]